MKQDKHPTYFYPDLGCRVLDLWFVRIDGHGLGNSFFSYFHAVALSSTYRGIVITPAWFSLKIGTFLRRETSKRLYWRMFKPFPEELSYFSKICILLKQFGKRNFINISGKGEINVLEGTLNVVRCLSYAFTFDGLHPYRDVIRNRLLTIVNDPIPANHSWGGNNFIAVHVRLGDFTETSDAKKICSDIKNIRIPLSWYVNVIRALQSHHPSMPIRIFSDGKRSELEPLLNLGATLYRSGSDITDLLVMSSASILVGSRSTYSQWAVFLGDMPSIWIKTTIKEEKPSAPHTPILYIPIDATPSGIPALKYWE